VTGQPARAALRRALSAALTGARRMAMAGAVGAMLAWGGVPLEAQAAPGRQPPAPRGIAIDQRLAEDAALTLGSRVRLSATPGVPGDGAVVTAILGRRADPAEVARREYRVRLHLGQLQQLLEAPDRVDRFAVALRPGARADSVVARVNHVAFGFRAHPSAAVAVRNSRTFRVVERFHRAIGIITVVASAVFLLCLLLLSVEERRREVAALRLLGVSRRTVLRALVLEAALVSLAGSALGAVVGVVAAWGVNAHFQQLYRTPLAFAFVTPGILLFATGISLLLGVGAGAVAGWRLVRSAPLALLGR
jgi:ABC-type lipoprotein release transport system permease subunit